MLVTFHKKWRHSRPVWKCPVIYVNKFAIFWQEFFLGSEKVILSWIMHLFFQVTTLITLNYLPMLFELGLIWTPKSFHKGMNYFVNFYHVMMHQGLHLNIMHLSFTYKTHVESNYQKEKKQQFQCENIGSFQVEKYESRKIHILNFKRKIKSNLVSYSFFFWLSISK